MSLTETATDLLKAGWTIERIRSELRGTVLGCGDFPTCSAVEEAIAAAKKALFPGRPLEQFSSTTITLFLNFIQIKGVWPCEMKIGEPPRRLTIDEAFKLRDDFLAFMVDPKERVVLNNEHECQVTGMACSLPASSCVGCTRILEN